MAITGVSHFGLCISDLDASIRFYCELLGFRLLGRRCVARNDDVSRLLELDGLLVELAFIERDGTRIELLQFEQPRPTGGGKAPFNRIGYTHLSVKVADFDAELARLRAAGVTLLEDGIGADAASNARFAFILDPDGNRIELFGAIDESALKPWEMFDPVG